MRNKRRFYVLVAAVALTVAFLMVAEIRSSRQEQEQAERSLSSHVVTMKGDDADTAATESLQRILNAKFLQARDERIPTAASSRLKPASAFFPAVSGELPTSLDVIRQPGYWLDKAKRGDPIAALVVFETISNCLVFADDPISEHNLSTGADPVSFSTDCRSMKREVASNRVKWLEVAAEKGDLLSQITFASQAFATLSAARADGRMETFEVRQLVTKSLQFLEAASHRGVREAYLHLFAGYASGYFGPVDNISAYAYLSAWSALDSQFPLAQLKESFAVKRLRPGDLQVAELRARKIAEACCS